MSPPPMRGDALWPKAPRRPELRCGLEAEELSPWARHKTGPQQGETTMRALSVPIALALVAGAALAGALQPAFAQARSPELQAVIDGARKEGKLVLHSGPEVLGGSSILREVKAGIKTKFGVDIDIQFTPGPSMGVVGNKIMTEFNAGQPASTDVWTAAAPQVVPTLGADMFRKVEWAKLLPGRITDNLVEADGRALRVATGVPGVLYNVSAEATVAKINVMDDLLKPELKGQFATTPFLAGFDVLAAPSVWGPEKTLAYIAKLSKQVEGIFSCGGENRIASGEFPIFIMDCAGFGPQMKQFEGILKLKIIRDNAQRRPYYALIPMNAANPNAAILYVLFMSMDEGQQLLWDHWGTDLYEYPDSHRHKELSALEAKGIKFQDVTIGWWHDQNGLNQSIGQMIKTFNASK
jgi:ABC-type Fe3+ transport system substrate-binding protein